MNCENSFVDLHNHLVYGVDDGAADLQVTAAMLADAQKNHIGVIAATSHVRADFDAVQYTERLKEVQNLAARYDIKVVPGAEYNGRLFPDQPPYLTLGGVEGGAVLVDFRIPYLPPEFPGKVDTLFNTGNTLILAHPERTFPPTFRKEIERLCESGVCCQVTAGSLLGKFGAISCKIAWELLANGQARLIASDAHNAAERASCLAAAYDAVERRFGKEAATVLQQNARNVLEAPRTTLAPIPLRRFRLQDMLNWFRH